MARTVRDAAIVLDVIAGYDPRDPMTAYAIGHVPGSYAALLDRDRLRGARLGVMSHPMDPNSDPMSADYAKVKAVVDRAMGEMKRLGAELVYDLTIPRLDERLARIYRNNRFESERAINAYLAEHPNAPAKSLAEIISSNTAVPSRARGLRGGLGATTADAGYLDVLLAKEETRQIVLTLMADNRLDALVYATSDHQPTEIPPDVLTNAAPKDGYNRGSNRYLASGLAFPAITVPAGFTSDGLPVGVELMGRPFSEGILLTLAYAFEQATQYRRPPVLTPALPGKP
jgi:Asp-tRNA(Asn)/Glu-tRNA(Gln) amidotransferase A subunit family amidase